jgi:hypothetical protein
MIGRVLGDHVLKTSEGERRKRTVPRWLALESIRPVYRLRDLTRRGQLVAALLCLATVLPMVVALFQFISEWAPTGDNALIALRTLDVGTFRTPLLGQPSTSAEYGSEAVSVMHLGPWHFYLMAPFVRTFGSSAGMLAVSVLLSSTFVLLSIWAVFRRLGPRGGVLGAAAMGIILFAVGNAPLLNPISSNFARLPMLCAAVLAWAVMAGDDRLLPAATVVASFAMQEHLSAGPASAVLALACLVGAVVLWWRSGVRSDRVARRRAAGIGLVAAGVGLVVWLPLFLQQAFGQDGNLSALFKYALENDEPKLGLAAAVRQVTNVLAYPPLLSDTQLRGYDLLREPELSAKVSATAVVVILALAGYRWLRAGDRRATLVVMAGVLLVAGLANGTTVPRGNEEGRLSFYHWIWPLSFFVMVALAYVVADVVRWGVRIATTRTGWRPHGAWFIQLGRWAPRTATAVVAMAMVVAAAVNPGLDRRSNTIALMSSSYPRDVYDSLTDQVLERDELFASRDMLLLSSGEAFYEGTRQAMALSLIEAGVSLSLPRRNEDFAHEDRLAWHESDVDGVVLVAVNGPSNIARRFEHLGTPVARYDIWEDFDEEAFTALYDQVIEMDTIELETEPEVPPEDESAVSSPDVLEDLGVRLDDLEVLAEASGVPVEDLIAELGNEDFAQGSSPRQLERLLERLEEQPHDVLTDVDDLELLIDHPLENPRLDPEMLARMRDSAAARQETEEAVGYRLRAVNIEVYIITEPSEIERALRWGSAGFNR